MEGLRDDKAWAAAVAEKDAARAQLQAVADGWDRAVGAVNGEEM